MEYILKLKATENDKSEEAFVAIYFPIGAYFTTHATVANALTALIPVLMGEVIQKLEPIADAEDLIDKPFKFTEKKDKDGFVLYEKEEKIV